MLVCALMPIEDVSDSRKVGCIPDARGRAVRGGDLAGVDDEISPCTLAVGG